MEIDKKWFYSYLKEFTNRHLPIFFDMTLSKGCSRYRLIFAWTSIKPNGDFNPIMTAQLIDITQIGSKKYVTKDLSIDCVKEHITSDYKLYKYLNSWVKESIKKYECEMRVFAETCKDCGFCTKGERK